MPNHVFQRLMVSGPTEDIEAMKAFVHEHGTEMVNKWRPQVNENGEPVLRDDGHPAYVQYQEEEEYDIPFSLNAVVPMPEVLKGTISGSHRSPRRVCPESAQQSVRAIAECGFSNWYDWCCANWGTKWNCYGFGDGWLPGLDRSQIIHFQTAWSPPTPVLLALSEKFPSLVFDHKALDEGWGFAYHSSISEGGETIFHEFSGAEMEAKTDEFRRFCDDVRYEIYEEDEDEDGV